MSKLPERSLAKATSSRPLRAKAGQRSFPGEVVIWAWPVPSVFILKISGSPVRLDEKKMLVSSTVIKSAKELLSPVLSVTVRTTA